MNYLLLHIIVFIWGFTGILGHDISLEAPQLVWYRMIIACLALALYNVVVRQKHNGLPLDVGLTGAKYPRPAIVLHWKSMVPAGIFVALHWIFFFGSIKASNINIGVVCMSTQAFMISLLQPLIKRTRIRPIELLMGLMVVGAMVLIFGFEYRYKTGIWMGLVSSSFAVLFTLLNAKMVKEVPATIISGWEMGIGAVVISFYLLFTGSMQAEKLAMEGNDLYYLLILGIVCTAFAFAVSVQIMKKLSPYTVSLSVNLEPVYTILLALALYPETEVMTGGFYAGTVILIGTVLADTLISLKINKK